MSMEAVWKKDFDFQINEIHKNRLDQTLIISGNGVYSWDIEGEQCVNISTQPNVRQTLFWTSDVIVLIMNFSNTFRIYHLSQKKVVATVSGHTQYIYCACIWNNLLITTSSDYTMRLWKIIVPGTVDYIATIDVGCNITALEVMPDNLLWTCSFNYFTVWQYSNSEDENNTTTNPSKSSSFHRVQKVKYVFINNAPNNFENQLPSIQKPSQKTTLDKLQQPNFSYSTTYARNISYQVQASPSIHNLGENFHSFSNVQQQIVINCMCSWNGHVVCGSDDALIRVYDADTSQITRVMQGHTGPLNCLYVWSSGEPDRDFALDKLCSGSTDCTVRIWKWNGFKCVSVLKLSRVPVVAITSYNTYTLTVGYEYTIKFFRGKEEVNDF